MTNAFQKTALVTMLFAALMTVVFLATPSFAGGIDHRVAEGTFQSRTAPAAIELATTLKAPTKRVKVKCNGKTTTQCCSGLSYCSCLYMPGSSDDTHPTSCHSTPGPHGGRG